MQQPTKYTLKNGLTVLLQESHSAPVISMNLCCKVGSRYEGPREGGMCHLIEHMIFKGTPTYPVGEIARQVEASGGDINAYTSFDETVFYINMASRYLDEGLKILADAALNPLFDAEELTREKEVVVEEISRAEDSPAQQVSEDLFRTAFTRHPYGRPIAGTRESVRAISRAELLSFYKKWYVGPNLILVIAGDFDTAKMRRHIQKLFGGFPAKNAPRVQSAKEPRQRKPRAFTRAMDIQGQYLALGYHTPELTHPDVPALDLLSHILGGSDSSRLDQEVKEETGLVRAIETACYTPEEPCLFLIEAELTGHRTEPVLQKILQEIHRLQSDSVSTAELARAKTALRSSLVYERETVQGLSRKIGYFEIVAGDYRFEETYYQGLEEVTPERIQEVAKRYLHNDGLNLVVSHPKKKGRQIKAGKLLRHVPKPRAPKKVRRSERRHDTAVYRFPNGIRLFVKTNPLVPLVSIRTATLGGTRFESPRNNGLSHLIAEVLTKGTHHRSALEISSQIESMAGSLSGYMGRNISGLRSSFLSEKLDEGIHLFCDVMLNPSFLPEELDKEKKSTLSAIRDQEDHPARAGMKAFMKQLFRKHPYALSLLGTKTSVQSIKPQHLSKGYERWIHPKNLVISLVGDVVPEQIRELVGEKLEGLERGKLPTSKVQAAKPLNKPSRLMIRKPGKKQAHIITGFLGSTVKSRDRFGLDVLNAVLSGQGGRLFIELRDKEGLAYSVSSSLYEGIEPGYFMVYMGTDPKNLDRALGGIERELEKITKQPISKEELSRAKRYLIGTYSLELQRNSSIGALMAYDEVYGLGFDDYLKYPEAIEKVSIGQVQAMAKKYIRLDQAVTVVVKP